MRYKGGVGMPLLYIQVNSNGGEGWHDLIDAWLIIVCLYLGLTPTGLPAPYVISQDPYAVGIPIAG